MHPLPPSPILKGLSEEDLDELRRCHYLREKKYQKEELIFHMGDTTHELGILLEGQVIIENIDLWDNKSILSSVDPGQVFGETYALSGVPFMVDAVAGDHCLVLLLDVTVFSRDQCRSCAWQQTLLRNLLTVTSNKNLILSNRIFCTTPKKIRGRLLTYLSRFAVKCGKTEFDIPFDRQQLADYLNLDRSALSKELGIMRDEGLLTYQKNHFKLQKVTEWMTEP